MTKHRGVANDEETESKQHHYPGMAHSRHNATFSEASEDLASSDCETSEASRWGAL